MNITNRNISIFNKYKEQYLPLYNEGNIFGEDRNVNIYVNNEIGCCFSDKSIREQFGCDIQANSIYVYRYGIQNFELLEENSIMRHNTWLYSSRLHYNQSNQSNPGIGVSGVDPKEMGYQVYISIKNPTTFKERLLNNTFQFLYMDVELVILREEINKYKEQNQKQEQLEEQNQEQDEEQDIQDKDYCAMYDEKHDIYELLIKRKTKTNSKTKSTSKSNGISNNNSNIKTNCKTKTILTKKLVERKRIKKNQSKNKKRMIQNKYEDLSHNNIDHDTYNDIDNETKYQDKYQDKYCGHCNKLVYRYDNIDIRDKRFYYGRIEQLCAGCYDSFVCSNCHSFDCIYTSYECELDERGYDVKDLYRELYR